MPNMSYCRFENTLADLRDCEEYMDDDLEPGSSEFKARKRLIQLCQRIAADWEPDEFDEGEQVTEADDE